MKTCPVCTSSNSETATCCTNCQSPLAGKHASTASIEKTILSHFDILSQQPGDVIDGRYRVVRQLGAGGMGAVFLVEDIELNDEQCALKLIHPELVRNPEARERFKSEVTTSRQLQHNGIIRVFDLGKSDQELYYFSMEYLKGQSLATLLEQRKNTSPPFSLDEIRQIITGILDAIGYAHTTTIHRDIKPDNIIIDGEYPDIKIKILDFGIARTMSNSRFTQTAQGLGTPYYMAPEQLQNAHTIDHRADLYGVGMILYELLTGTQAIGRFLLPSEILNDEYKPLDELIIRSLAPNPDQRYSDAEEMNRSFKHALAVVNKSQNNQTLPKEDDGSAISAATDSKSGALDITKSSSGKPNPRKKKTFPAIFSIIIITFILIAGGGLFFYLQEPSQPPVPPVPHGGDGHLLITTTPEDGKITMGDGSRYSPNMELPPGQYTLHIEKEGYISENRTIIVTQEETTKLHVRLQRILSTGHLTVMTIPDSAAVTIVNGPEYHPGIELEYGTYTLLVSSPGHKNVQKTVDITGDLELTVSLPLTTPIEKPGDKGVLLVQPTPAHAKVRIMNIEPKYTPEMELPPGQYHIETSCPGYITDDSWVTIRMNKIMYLRPELRLKPQGGSKPHPKPTPYPCPPGFVLRTLSDDVRDNMFGHCP